MCADVERIWINEIIIEITRCGTLVWLYWEWVRPETISTLEGILTTWQGRKYMNDSIVTSLPLVLNIKHPLIIHQELWGTQRGKYKMIPEASPVTDVPI